MRILIKPITIIIIGLLINGCTTSPPSLPPSTPANRECMAEQIKLGKSSSEAYDICYTKEGTKNIQKIRNARRDTYLSVEKQKEIYYELVKIQDSGRYTHQATYNVIATRYNISIQKVKNIAIEGIKANWKRP